MVNALGAPLTYKINGGNRVDDIQFIETPINPNWVGRAFTKMSKEKNNTKAPEAFEKPQKAKYAKTRGEHIKDVVIAVLVTAIIAFVSGMTFQGNQQKAIDTAVKSAQTVASQAPVKK